MPLSHQWLSKLYSSIVNKTSSLNRILNSVFVILVDTDKIVPFSLSQTAQTVLVVVVVFCLSWLPHHVVHLWVEFGTFPLNQASFVLRVAAHCLAYSNSSVNPVIYAFLSENFRKAYKQVFKCQIGTSDSPLNDIKDIRSKADTPPSTNCTNVWLTAATPKVIASDQIWVGVCFWWRYLWSHGYR